MGKPRKKKAHQKFDYDKNRKNLRRKEKRLPDIKCMAVKKAWDQTKSMSKNLKEMGLSSDVNKTIKLPMKWQSRQGLLEEGMEQEEQKTPIKKYIADGLEEQSKQPTRKKDSMSEEDAGFCVYMMEKYGEDYKAMCRDIRNVYQETPKQIRRKINRFKSLPKMYSIYTEARLGQGEANVVSS